MLNAVQNSLQISNIPIKSDIYRNSHVNIILNVSDLGPQSQNVFNKKSKEKTRRYNFPKSLSTPQV